MNRKLLLSLSLLNTVLLLILVVKTLSIQSDKNIVLLFFYYLLLMIVNFLVGGALYFLKSVNARVFFIVSGVLLAAMFPIVYLVSRFG